MKLSCKKVLSLMFKLIILIGIQCFEFFKFHLLVTKDLIIRKLASQGKLIKAMKTGGNYLI